MHISRSTMSNRRKIAQVLFIVLPALTVSPLLPLISATHLENTWEWDAEKSPEEHLHVQKHMQVAHSACEGTLYPDLCVSTLATFPALASQSTPQIISSLLNHTVLDVGHTSRNCTAIRKKFRKILGHLDNTALGDCLELLADTISRLRETISVLSDKSLSPAKHYNDLRTFLSAAMTNQATCLDGFAYSKTNVRSLIEKSVVQISRHVSNSLVILKKIPGLHEPKGEVFPEYGTIEDDGFPSWMSIEDRKWLLAPASDAKANVVVAKDGTGHFTTVGDAVKAAPKTSTKDNRYVIYIKEGAYFENVEVPSNKKYLVFLGDGIGKTIIKAYRSHGTNWGTYDSATVAVNGEGFLAKGITFENGAGAINEQAVALRSSSDFSAFYKCSFVGYQDTLYTHKLRQFYRECDVYGTIDFIFGNAAVVLQMCNLYARLPLSYQFNVFTAQGRDDANQNTGISILNCKVTAASDFIGNKEIKTYLGRPWKNYSRTVYLKSYLDDLIDPAGWKEWDGDAGLKTLYYGEYQNRGPGSDTSGRVKWPGYRVITSESEASQFTVRKFIDGDEWLGSTGIPYYSGFSPDKGFAL